MQEEGIKKAEELLKRALVLEPRWESSITSA